MAQYLEINLPKNWTFQKTAWCQDIDDKQQGRHQYSLSRSLNTWAASLKGLSASPASIPNSSSDPDGAVLPALPPLPGPRCSLGLWGSQWSTIMCFFSASMIYCTTHIPLTSLSNIKTSTLINIILSIIIAHQTFQTLINLTAFYIHLLQFLLYFPLPSILITFPPYLLYRPC